ncbi:MAG: glycosyltransferase family 9 protein [Pseudomonadota bacterium]
MPSLLFIAPADLGEAVLAEPALDAMLSADTAVDVVCSARAAALFRATPGLKATHILEGGGFRSWLRLARDLAEAHYDLAVDLSRRRLGYAVRAERRIVRGSPRILRHLSEEFAMLLGVEKPAPLLWLDDQARADATALAPTGPVLVLAPEAGGWATERFAAVARRLVGGAGPLSDATVLVLGEADAAKRAAAITTSLDADGVRARNLAGKLDILAAGALLERTTLCIATESPLMHIAAQVGAPTLALFGASDERIVGPFGRRTRTLRGRSYEDVMSGASRDDGLDELGVDAVEEAALEMLRAGGL